MVSIRYSASEGGGAGSLLKKTGCLLFSLHLRFSYAGATRPTTANPRSIHSQDAPPFTSAGFASLAFNL